MKRIAIFTLLLLFLVGCNSKLNGDGIVTDDIISEQDWCGIEWDHIQFPIDLNDVIPKEKHPIETGQIAIDMATTILERLHKDGRYPEYSLTSIVHSTEDNVWRFGYSIDQQDNDVDELIDCGCLYIAFDGEDGQVIMAWLEE